jgi:hypothetical protein
MNRIRIAAMALGLLAVAGCVTPVGPVQVTRFHAADISPLGKGTISVEPAPGSDGNSIEWQTYRAAVMRQLERLGYTEAGPGTGAQVAHMKVTRSTIQPQRSGGPVSVGWGRGPAAMVPGSGWAWGSTSRRRPPRRSKPNWQSRSATARRAKRCGKGAPASPSATTSPLADTGLAAPKMAEALFAGFPGQSGETIEVK